jgi:hypothetical protein
VAPHTGPLDLKDVIGEALSASGQAGKDLVVDRSNEGRPA